LNKNNKIKLKIIDINNDETQIKIDNKDYVKTIIKLYCESKEESESNELYLAKKDLNKLDENLTVNEAKINNNETLYIFEEDKIEFIINYNDKDFQISGNSKMTFDESIKSFIEENGNKNFVFNLNGEAIDIKEELNKLGIKNGDVIKADQEK
jgi:hypothetical protein